MFAVVVVVAQSFGVKLVVACWAHIPGCITSKDVTDLFWVRCGLVQITRRRCDIENLYITVIVPKDGRIRLQIEFPKIDKLKQNK